MRKVVCVTNLILSPGDDDIPGIYPNLTVGKIYNVIFGSDTHFYKITDDQCDKSYPSTNFVKIDENRNNLINELLSEYGS